MIVTGPEDANEYEAEFWRGNELIGTTVLDEGRLHLRVGAQPDGSPRLADTVSPARALANGKQQLAAY